MINQIEFVKDITRMNMGLVDVKIWACGENEELKKWIDFGFLNHLFICENKNVTLYCDKMECDKFYEVLTEKLDERLFNNLCIRYFELVDKIQNASKDELNGLLIEIWPMLTIFQEVSLYPEFISERDLRRLIRIREITESKIYEFFKLLEVEEEPDKYHFFQGRLYPEKLNLSELNIVT